MNKNQIEKVVHGIYKIFWKEGGISVASVGSTPDGKRWFAPTNWTNVPSFNWGLVKKLELITDQEIELIKTEKQAGKNGK